MRTCGQTFAAVALPSASRTSHRHHHHTPPHHHTHRQAAEHDVRHVFELVGDGRVERRMVVPVDRAPPARHAVDQRRARLELDPAALRPGDRVHGQRRGHGRVRVPEVLWTTWWSEPMADGGRCKRRSGGGWQREFVRSVLVESRLGGGGGGRTAASKVACRLAEASPCGRSPDGAPARRRHSPAAGGGSPRRSPTRRGGSSDAAAAGPPRSRGGRVAPCHRWCGAF